MKPKPYLFLFLCIGSLCVPHIQAQTSIKKSNLIPINEEQHIVGNDVDLFHSTLYSTSTLKEVESTKTWTDFFCFVDAIIYLAELQGELMDIEQSEGVDRYTSIEIRSQFGSFPSNYPIFTTKVQAHWGLFSASIRYRHQFMSGLAQQRLESKGHYSTLDIQYLQLNVLPFRQWNIRMGLGSMRNLTSNEAYPESTLSLDIYPIERLRCSAQGRFAHNTEITKSVRREWNAGFYYRLGKKYTRQNIHAHLDATLTDYPTNLHFWLISGGLSVRLE